jgi:AraC-like DNA-binding protein
VAVLASVGVSYEETPPPPALAPWVATLWRVHSQHPFDLRVLPDGCVDLIGRQVVGSFTTAQIVRLRPGEIGIGVRFRPGGFSALFGVPASDLVDRRAPLEDVVPARSLLHHASRAPRPDALAELALQARSVRELAAATGYSERQLRRRLVRTTGFGPKMLGRIGRMHRLLRAGRGESWARTAVEQGFFDEAHMANDIRELAGATPHALLRDVDGRFLQDSAAART